MIKVIETCHLRDYVLNNQRAYPTLYKGSDDELQNLVDRYTKLFLEEKTLHPIGFFQGDVLMGNMLLIEFEMNFRGQLVKVGGVGSVAVNPLFKKQGVAKALIQYALKWSEEQNHLFHILYPFNTEFYKNFNFGYSIPRHKYTFEPSAIDCNPVSPSPLRWIVNSDHENLADFSMTQSQKTIGCIAPSILDRRRISKARQLQGVLYEENHQIQGYMLYETKGLDTNYPLNQKICVTALEYNKPHVLHTFLSHLKKQIDQVAYIELNSLDDHFQYVLNTIIYAEKPKMHMPINHKLSEVGLGIMTRVINIKKAVEMTTTDAFTLIVEKNKEATENISINGGGDPLKITLSDLSSVLFGAVSLETLASLGKVTPCHPLPRLHTNPVKCNALF